MKIKVSRGEGFAQSQSHPVYSRSGLRPIFLVECPCERQSLRGLVQVQICLGKCLVQPWFFIPSEFLGVQLGYPWAMDHLLRSKGFWIATT